VANEERLADLARRLEAQGTGIARRSTSNSLKNAKTRDVRERYRVIAQHYLDLAEEQERSSKQETARGQIVTVAAAPLGH
jgi:hypothetical protein